MPGRGRLGSVDGRLFADGDGWLRWTPDPAPDVTLRVQLEPEGGRQRIARLELEGEVSAKVLRSIPLGRIEASANVVFGHDSQTGSTTHSSVNDDRREVRSRGGWELDDDGELHEAPVHSTRSRSLVLDGAAPRTRKPEHFYENVAELYRELAVESSKPSVLIAEANDVPVTTVHRWVKEARRRELLPPGRTGTAG